MSNGTRGRITETPSGSDPGGSGSDPLGGAEGGENGTGGTGSGSELPPVTSDNSGGGAPGVGNAETTGQRKRGRPSGSTNKAGGAAGAAAKLSRTELRTKLTGALSGLVSFGFSAVGSSRAEKLKPVSLGLANSVFQTWLVSEEQAQMVAEPAAATLVEYLPDKWLQTVATTVDPLACVTGLYVLIATRLAQEKGIVDQFVDVQKKAREAAAVGPPEMPAADVSGIPDPVQSADHPTAPDPVNE